MTYVYMKISEDELELPEAVANSVRELAEITGENSSTISSMISRWKNKNMPSRFIRVEIDEEDD